MPRGLHNFGQFEEFVEVQREISEVSLYFVGIWCCFWFVCGDSLGDLFV